jgi:hypothetical protein
MMVAAAACTPSAEPQASGDWSAAPAASSAAGNLPPGCEAIELRAPSGGLVELDGTWTEVGTVGSPMTWWLRTEGSCVWGAGHVDDIAPEGSPDAHVGQVQSLSGVIGSDFVIDGEVILLGAARPLCVCLTRYSPLRMLIEFDDAGEIRLREDREPGVTGPRCSDPVLNCLTPLVLQPVD